MRRHLLGRTNLEVSELALGTVELGLDYGIGAAHRPSESAAAALLHYALDHGVTLIDTARAYGNAERIIGEALKGRRDEYVLVSKVRPEAASIPSLVEESLRDLQTDHIDVVLLHCAGDAPPDPEATGVLQRCREQGKVRFMGASVYGPAAAMDAIQSGDHDCLEIGYSVLDRRPEVDVLAAAADAGVGILARSVLLKGALSPRYRDLPKGLASLKQCVERLAAIAGSAERLPEFAYRYVLGRTPPHAALIGTACIAELQAGIDYTSMGPLADDLVAAAQLVHVEEERYLNPGLWPA